MKNFKKVLAFTLAFALMLSSMNMAFAEETMKSEAQKLNDLGLLAGVADTELGAEVTRAVGLTMVLKAIGYTQEDANAKAADNPYIDIKYDWVKGFAALGTELGITDGVGEKKFGPMQKMDEKQLVTFMLRALGYNAAETWAKAGEWGVEAGLIADADFAKVKFTKDAAAKIMFNALKADLKGEGQKGRLIDKLIKDGATTREKAVDAGLMAAAPATLEVVSVKASNLREVTVEFNQELDKKSAEKKDNYRVKGSTVESASLSEDGVTVILIIKDGSLKNQSKTELTVMDVKAADGKKIEKTKVTFVPFDGELPEVQSIKVTGPQSFTVEFNEPIKLADRSGIKVKQDKTTLAVKNAIADGKKVMVELYSSMKDGKEYNVVISKATDYAGYNNKVYAETIAYAKNNEVPVAKIVSADQRKVVVEFDKPVSGLSTGHFYHTFSAWAPKEIYVMEKGEKKDIELSDKVTKVYVAFARPKDKANGANVYPLQPGTVDFNIRGKNSKGKEIKDAWGNKFVSESFSLEIVADKEAPTVVEVKATGNNSLEVVFSEAVVMAKANFKLLNSDGKDQYAIEKIESKEDGKVASIKLSKSFLGKTMQLLIKNIKDTSLTGNKMADTTETITFDDKVAPKVDTVLYKFDANGAGEDDDTYKLYVTYSEDVDDTALEVNNYVLAVGASAPYENVKLTESVDFHEGSSTVVISLTKDQAKKIDVSLGGGAVSPARLIVKNVTDVNGNSIQATLTPEIESSTNVKPALVDKDQAILAKKNEIHLKFNTEISKFDESKGIEIVAGAMGYDGNNVRATTNAKVDRVVLGEDRKTLIVILDQNFYDKAAPKLKVNAEAVTNIFGEKNVELNPIAVDKDKVAPEIEYVVDPDDSKNFIPNVVVQKGTSDDDELVINYTEKISTRTADNHVYYALNSSEASSDLLKDALITRIDQAKLTFVLAKVVEDATADFTFEQKIPVKDLNDNSAMLEDTLKPQNKLEGRLVKAVAEIGTKNLTLTFSKPVKGSGAVGGKFTFGMGNDLKYTDAAVGGATKIDATPNPTKVVYSRIVTVTVDADFTAADVSSAPDTLTSATSIVDEDGTAIVAGTVKLTK